MIEQLVTQGPILLASVLVVFGLWRVVVDKSSVALWVLLGVFALTGAIVPSVNLQATVAGVTLYAMDLIAGLMFVIGVIRLLARPNPASLFVPLAALSCLFLVHAGSGMVDFGLQAGVNGSRSWLYVIGPLIYGSQARPPWTRESFFSLIIASCAISAFALVQIARYGLYAANEYIDVGGQLVDARPVTAVGALLIVQCLVLAVAGRFVRSSLWWVAIGGMAAAAVLLQHRTIWIVAVAAAVLGYLKWARVAILANERAALAVASAVLFLSPVVLIFVASSSAFDKSIRSATGSQSTLEWRWESWKSLTESHDSIQDRVVGVPAGTSLERRIDGRVATQSPHSVYVDSFLSLGVLGPVLIVALWILIVKHRRTASYVLGIPSVAVVLIVATDALFGITNMLGPPQGLLMGMLLQAGLLSERASTRGAYGSTSKSSART